MGAIKSFTITQQGKSTTDFAGTNIPATTLTGSGSGATFDITTQLVLEITPSAGSNGSISPNTKQDVDQGSDSVTFTFTPDAGYRIDQVLIDGTPNAQAKTNGYYTFTNVQTDHTIAVSFVVAITHQLYINPYGYPITMFYRNEAEIAGPTSASPEVYIYLTQSFPLVQTHLYYCSYEIKCSSASHSTDMYWPEAEPNFLSGVSVTPANTWRKATRRRDRSTFTDTTVNRFRVDLNGSAVGDTWSIRRFVFIDLTAVYGAGYEPSLTWLDAQDFFVKGGKVTRAFFGNKEINEITFGNKIVYDKN